MTQDECPFKAGDEVFYRPSVQGYSKTVMSSPDGQPQVGQRCRVARVVRNRYIVCEGFESPGGGIYWTEFSAN